MFSRQRCGFTLICRGSSTGTAAPEAPLAPGRSVPPNHHFYHRCSSCVSIFSSPFQVFRSFLIPPSAVLRPLFLSVALLCLPLASCGPAGSVYVPLPLLRVLVSQCSPPPQPLPAARQHLAASPLRGTLLRYRRGVNDQTHCGVLFFHPSVPCVSDTAQVVSLQP